MNPSAGPAVGVQARLVYFEYTDSGVDYSGCSEPLIAVLRDSDDATKMLATTFYAGHTGMTDWEVHHLHGVNQPYLQWPDVEEVHLVSSGGIGNAFGNTDLDPTGLAVFADLASAEAFATKHARPSVVVRTVPVGRLLPV